MTHDPTAIVRAALEAAADSLIETSVWCDSQERADASWHNGVVDARKHHMRRILAIDPSTVLSKLEEPWQDIATAPPERIWVDIDENPRGERGGRTQEDGVMDENARLRAADALAKAVLAVKRIKETQMRTADYHGEGCRCWRCKEDAMFAALDAYETAALTLTPGKRYLDGHGEVKGPLHRIHWENGEEMLTDSYVVWHPDGTLAGGTREDKRSLVAEVE